MLVFRFPTRMAKEIPNNMRKRIIYAYNSGKGYTELGKLVGCHRTTIKRIVDAYLQKGRMIAKKRGGAGGSKRLDNVHISAIRTYINQNCTISLRALREKINEEFGLEAGKSTINRAIDSFNYTLKRVSQVLVKRNHPTNLECRFAYASLFFQLSQQGDGNIFFLDEVGLNVSMRKKRGRSLCGERAVLSVPAIRNRNISVYCAITKHRTFFYKKQDRPFNTETFSEFVDELIAKLDQEGRTNTILVLDNVPFNKSQIIRTKVEESSHTLFFTTIFSLFESH
jgi:transposase